MIKRYAQETGSPVRLLLYYGILPVIFLLHSCTDANKSHDPAQIQEALSSTSFDAAGFAEQVQLLLPVADTLDSNWHKKQFSDLKSIVSLSYQLNQYKPFWITDTRNTANADQLIAEIDSIRWDGIDPGRYQPEQLAALKAKATAEQATLADAITFDTACTATYLRIARDLLLGIYIPKKADTLWFHSNDSAWNAYTTVARMGNGGNYESLDQFRPKWPQYQLMRQSARHYYTLSRDSSYASIAQSLSMTSKDSLLSALIQYQMPWLTATATDSMTTTQQLLRGFQYYRGQKMTGKLDSATYERLNTSPEATLRILALNEERMRWMNQAPEENHVIVPIPLMELWLVHNQQQGMHMRVVVGKPSRQTPSLNAVMANIVLNPPWGVPPTILKNDIGPGVSKSGASYLSRKGLKAYDGKGKIVDGSRINGSNYRNYSYRQPPGARNALGVVKFNLPNKWDIYLHDTPHKEDFPNRNRAKSSGCIRVAEPVNMAWYILTEMEGKGLYTKEHIDSVVETHKTQYQTLSHKIPVHIVYLTAFQDSTGSQLRLLDDIYKHDRRMSLKTSEAAKKS